MRKHWHWLNLLKVMWGEPWAWRVAALFRDTWHKQCERKRQSEFSTFRALIALSVDSQCAYLFETIFLSDLSIRLCHLDLRKPWKFQQQFEFKSKKVEIKWMEIHIIVILNLVFLVVQPKSHVVSNLYTFRLLRVLCCFGPQWLLLKLSSKYLLLC